MKREVYECRLAAPTEEVRPSEAGRDAPAEGMARSRHGSPLGAKKHFLVVVIALVLGGGYAQDAYVGASLGAAYVIGFVGIPITAQVGFEVSPSVDIRGDLSYYITGGGIQFGPNVLGRFGDSPELTGYAGGGPRFLVDTFSGFALFGFGGLGGAEYMVDPQVGLFGEGGLDVYLPVGIPVLKLATGVNFHF